MRHLRCLAVLLFVFAGALAAPPLAAQADVPALARIDTLIANSRFTEARNSLDRWLASDEGKRRSGEVAAQVLLLRGRLATSADSALLTYLDLALNHPASRQAPEALLRLGQGHAAAGDARRALGYLERLVRDYPGYEQRGIALLWLARTQLAERQTEAACRSIAQGLEIAAANAPLRSLLEAERTRCAAAPQASSAERVSQAEQASEAGQASADARFTIQVGAFRDAAAAHRLADRLRARDIDARVVRVGDGTLAQVRAGSFPSRAAAAELLARVRRIVPEAVIAGDVAREHPVQR